MREIYLKAIPSEQTKGLRARVTSEIQRQIPRNISESIWQDLSEDASRNGRRLQNKERYFFTGLDEQGINMALGT
jgi:hypothetical protein